MTETSYFWDGLATGDAALAPYSSDLWHALWQTMFSRADNEGVLNNVDGELAVSGVSGSASVATGKALVDGTLYENDSAVSVTIPAVGGNPRIDRIVVQKDWSLKTIRIARVEGVENPSPTAPALTQIAGDKWEIPLAQLLVVLSTGSPLFTVTDERENARTRLALAGAGISEIETFVATGVETAIDFTNIPSTFKHLEVRGNILSQSGGAGSAALSLNGDTAAANYMRQVFANVGGVVAAAPSVGTILPVINSLGSGALDAMHNTQFFMRIPNYRGTTFYKSGLQKEAANADNTAANLAISIEEFLWLNTDAIDRITLTITSGGTIDLGTVATLFGTS